MTPNTVPGMTVIAPKTVHDYQREALAREIAMLRAANALQAALDRMTRSRAIETGAMA